MPHHDSQLSHLELSENLQKITDSAVSLVPSTDANRLSNFIQSYYQNLNPQVLQSLTPQDLAGMAVQHYSLLLRYQPNQPQVMVSNPNFETQHFHTSNTVIQMVAYDRPFLVDTLLMCLDGLNSEGLDITVHRLHNTIMAVERDAEGKLLDVSSTNTSDTKFLSLIHCEIGRQSDDVLEKIRLAILDKINILDVVVTDWQAMRDKLVEVKNSLTQVNAVQTTDTGELVNIDQSETQAFLDWVLDNNFIFLGYREYRYEKEDSGVEIYSLGNTGLGLLRDNSEEKLSDSFHQLPPALRSLANKPQVLLLSKSRNLSPVHRPVYMDFVGIQKFNETGEIVGEYRFIGLLTAAAYQLNVTQIPMLRQKVNSVLSMAHLPANGHAYNKFKHILNTLPRDDLFQASTDELYPMVMGIANLHDKNQLRLFARIDHFERFVSCLVYIPRDKFNTQLRMQIQSALVQAFNGVSSGFTTEFSETYHARVHIHVRTQPGNIPNVDLAQLERKLTQIMQGWHDSVSQIFISELGEVQGKQLLQKYLPSIPASYQEDYAPRIALEDIKRLEKLNDTSLTWHLYQTTGETDQQLHLKVYGKGEPATLSKILPVLENFGLDVITAQTYEFSPHSVANNETSDYPWLQEYSLTLRHHSELDMAVVGKQVEEALALIWQGDVENDTLNELVLITPLDVHEVAILRALSHYMRQVKVPFSLPYIKQTLIKYPDISENFIRLFHARMMPADVINTDVTPQSTFYSAVYDAKQQAKTIPDFNANVSHFENLINQALKDVQSLDEDKILHWVLDLLAAMVRTNYYQRQDTQDKMGGRKNRLSFKFAASQIPNLPKPKPMFEIFVYSPKVEAVHLRGGKVARGGLRWSDRMEDFRTEVLGLVKAQMVKNAVIVPVGSKGGFIVKTKSPKDGREVFAAEGVACYQTFIRGMLDITDNLVDGQVIAPANTPRLDGDDPYLVVAADKGTATFSDIANGVSAEYGFWLGDAFASGGSVGYDHKAMGITARGAWESVKRHFRLLGKDIQTKDDFTVIGIGDMSGDVFGNGMLLSPRIKLVAAFNHLHIFIDPNPDTATSFAERERLFKLPRSTWADYDASLISAGGGIFSRQDKSIEINPQMQQVFGITATALTPDELIHALLQAPVDLIWNGGIGTYVKSEDETHADVGDRANEAVRINGNQLRAKVFGEGGNLGMTQRGRIEFAQNSGHLYTDAIDNSGGVNCSDHEVNIKILLGNIVAQGDMTLKQRNELLASMTDDVGNLVLRQNYLQPQAIELSAKDGVQNLPLHQKFMQYLEQQERLDRAIEYLPADDVIYSRQKSQQGLTNPELAVILAYGKMWVYDNLLASDVPDDSYFIQELSKYFPNILAEKYFEQMTTHPLHREIISTYLTNSLVNRLGIELVYQLFDETHHSVATITRAYSIVRDVFDVSQHWQIIEALDNQVDAHLQLQLESNLRHALSQSMNWLLATFGDKLAVNELVAKLKSGVQTLMAEKGILAQHFAESLNATKEQLAEQGLPDNVQHLFAVLPFYAQALDAVWLAEQRNQPVDSVAQVYFATYDLLSIDWLRQQAQQLPQHSYWERRASQALNNDILQTLRQYVVAFLADDAPLEAIGQFKEDQSESLNNVATIANNPNETVSLATLSVLLSEINGLQASV